ncbi:hypothetical protein [Streptomyces sp. NPDC047009]|uniref:hypothetical protein n=1 Tax=Streptomyces sp. NPDC047009 TaxID=3154496 RepID=UPI0033FD24CA
MSRLIRATVVTFAEAEAIIDEDGHGETDGNPDGLARVYVSPEVDGWTLVIGWWCDPCDGERSDEVLRLCTELSARYGRAQAYYYGARATVRPGSSLRGVPCCGGTAQPGKPKTLSSRWVNHCHWKRARREQLGLSPA